MNNIITKMFKYIAVSAISSLMIGYPIYRIYNSIDCVNSSKQERIQYENIHKGLLSDVIDKWAKDSRFTKISEDMLSDPDARVPFMHKNDVSISSLKDKYIVYTHLNKSLGDFDLHIDDKIYLFVDRGKTYIVPFNQTVNDWLNCDD